MPAFTKCLNVFFAQNPQPQNDKDIWWEVKAKTAISDFCKRFSRAFAVRRRHTRILFTLALGEAQVAADWDSVQFCRDKIVQLDKEEIGRAHV